MKRNTFVKTMRRENKFTTAFTAAAFTLLPLFATAQRIERIDPPNWWRGMATDTVELLVYGQELDQVKDVRAECEGLEVLHWQTASNPNYGYLTLWVQEGEACRAELRFGKGRKARFIWPVEERPAHKPAAHDESDVLYLITPDRFANGDPANDIQSDMNETALDRSEPFGRHGGDIQGIIEHLDYLNDLGITSIWSCPLLENDMEKQSYHGYAITDHYAIDPRFGDNDLYGQLSDGLHQRGMKLVMDAVYNHCGDQHPLHLDPPEKDWVNGNGTYVQTNYRAAAFIDPNASRSDLRTFQDGWFVPVMPDLNQRNTHVAKYLLQNTLWWIATASIDAIRVDTYAYPDQKFMNELLRAVHREYPGFLFFGEIWVTGAQIQGGWARNQSMLGEKSSLLPQVLDFQFCFGLQEMVKEKPGWAEGVGRFYLTLAGDWMYEQPRGMITFADNHDMGRIFGEVNEDLARFKAAMGVLLTSRGIPCIYYGTEVLMKETANHGVIREDFSGGWPGDPRNKFTAEGRNAQENQAFDLIRTLSFFRREHPKLFRGEFVHFIPQEGLYIYFRRGGEQTMMCVFNSSDEVQKVDWNRLSEFTAQGMGFKSILDDRLLTAGEEAAIEPLDFNVFYFSEE